MKVNWYNGFLYVLFTFLGIYDLTTGDYEGCVIWLMGAILNLAVIIIVHQWEIKDKIENIEHKLTNKCSDIDSKLTTLSYLESERYIDIIKKLNKVEE